MKRKNIVLIPAYQPNNDFISLIEKIKLEIDDIIVVDDGSGVDYQMIFDEISKKCVVLTHSVNQGKGSALKTGFRYIQNHYSSYVIVTMDCDGQHRIEDAMKIVDYANNHPDELVLGSRKLDKNVPLRSKIGNGITRKVFFLVSKVRVFDTQTGLRAFSDSLMSTMISIDGDRFEYEINVLLECAKRNILIHEIWIDTIYINRNSGSHFHTVRDSFKIYKQIFSYMKKK